MSRYLVVGRAAERLLDELNSMMTKVSESPMAFRTVHADVRRAALRVFPYLVWFMFDEDGDRVQVLAVTHQRRDPTVVRARLSD